MTRLRKVTLEDRRRALVRRHQLGGEARTPEEVVAALVALQVTDPASVYLSVLARSANTTLDDIAHTMYHKRRLVRWTAMRRTLFVFARGDIPMIQAASSGTVATALRKRLVRQVEHNGGDPAKTGDVGQWVADAEARVEQALAAPPPARNYGPTYPPWPTLGRRVPLLAIGVGFDPSLPAAARGVYVASTDVPRSAGPLTPAGERFAREADEGNKPQFACSRARRRPSSSFRQSRARTDGTRASVLGNLRASRVTDGILGSFRFDRNGDLDPPVMPIERLAVTRRGAPIKGAVFDRLITIPESLARP